jgi:hypothetical protein
MKLSKSLNVRTWMLCTYIRDAVCAPGKKERKMNYVPNDKMSLRAS